MAIVLVKPIFQLWINPSLRFAYEPFVLKHLQTVHSSSMAGAEKTKSSQLILSGKLFGDIGRCVVVSGGLM